MRFVFKARGKDGVSAATKDKAACIDFLNAMCEEELEECLMLEQPPNYKETEQGASTSINENLLQRMSDSVRLTKLNAAAGSGAPLQLALPAENPRPPLSFGDATVGIAQAGHSMDKLEGLPVGHYFLDTSPPPD